MTLIDDHIIATPAIPPGVPLRLLGAAPSLWRVIDRRGRAIGHLQAVDHDDGVRYRARRFHSATRVFHELGEFCAAADALDCLRFAR